MTSNKKRRAVRGIKRGRPFQQVVRDVVHAMDPAATVTENDWIVGPDGRRDRDVFVDGMVGGVRRRVLIECKDYNPQTTGPVGIGVVDELDSKRRDLCVDVALICSNSGFAEPAFNKARRVGIGLIGVMRKDDDRIRYRIEEEIYLRDVRLTSTTFSFGGVAIGESETIGATAETLLYQGAPVVKWIFKRIYLLVLANNIVNGTFRFEEPFVSPVEFEKPGGRFYATSLQITALLSGRWLAQRIAIEATEAIYDWIRRRVTLTPTGGTISYKDIDFDRGKLIDRPPPLALRRSADQLGANQSELASLARLDGFDFRGPVADLNPMLTDSSLFLPGVPVELTTSGVGPFSRDGVCFNMSSND